MTDSLNTPAGLARMLAGTGFDHAGIEQALAEQFPDADLTGVVDAAVAQSSEWDAELDREVRKEQDAAIAAEHDEGKK